MDELKQKVQSVINNKHLTSIMNNTKWELLLKSMKATLPFRPSFQVKYVLEDTPYPQNFEEDEWYEGDWDYGLRPFYIVEWIKVRPRIINHRGRLIKPEIIDITDELVAKLQKLNIPFVNEDNTIYIYGYVNYTENFN